MGVIVNILMPVKCGRDFHFSLINFSVIFSFKEAKEAHTHVLFMCQDTGSQIYTLSLERGRPLLKVVLVNVLPCVLTSE